MEKSGAERGAWGQVGWYVMIIQFSVSSTNPSEVGELAVATCRRVFATGPGSYQPYRMIDLGPAACGEVIAGMAPVWCQEFLASTEHANKELLWGWYKYRQAARDGRSIALTPDGGKLNA